MKKYIIATIATACAVSAYAKSTDELVAEFRALDSSQNVKEARQNYVRENIADIRAAWQKNKNSPYVKFQTRAVAEWVSLSPEAKQNKLYMRSLFSHLYAADGDIDAPDDVKISLNCWKFVSLNPDAWAAIKAAGYKVGGIEIPLWFGLEIGLSTRDIDTVYRYRDGILNRSAEWLDAKCEAVRRMCLYAADTTKAKAVCNEFENAMLLHDCQNTEKIQAVGKALTARIIDAKISK